jgi:hypothetical protein
LNLKCNLKKSKIMVFKKGGKLKATERREMNEQNSDVVDKFNYRGVILKAQEDGINRKH